jgi:hypothetical protein
MKIIQQYEPETSEKELKKYEEKYKIKSELFYENFQKGINLIGDDREAIDWAFEYEINQLAKKIE